MLKRSTAYMLNIKGDLIELPYAHPYLIDYRSKTPITEQMENCIKSWPEDFIWYYENTDSKRSKELAKTILAYLYFDERYKDKYIDDYGKYIVRLINTYFDDSVYDISISKETDVADLWKELSDNLNEEFTRVRTSHITMPSDANQNIYFRIGSKYTNWFDTIWKIVYKYKEWIESVTIVTDWKSKKEEKFYILGNQKTDHMNVDNFINLKGNPIVESFCQRYHIY